MKFTLKNIGALGFGSQMHRRERSALKLLTNNICVFFFAAAGVGFPCCWSMLSELGVLTPERHHLAAPFSCPSWGASSRTARGTFIREIRWILEVLEVKLQEKKNIKVIAVRRARSEAPPRVLVPSCSLPAACSIPSAWCTGCWCHWQEGGLSHPRAEWGPLVLSQLRVPPSSPLPASPWPGSGTPSTKRASPHAACDA